MAEATRLTVEELVSGHYANGVPYFYHPVSEIEAALRSLSYERHSEVMTGKDGSWNFYQRDSVVAFHQKGGLVNYLFMAKPAKGSLPAMEEIITDALLIGKAVIVSPQVPPEPYDGLAKGLISSLAAGAVAGAALPAAVNPFTAYNPSTAVLAALSVVVCVVGAVVGGVSYTSLASWFYKRRVASALKKLRATDWYLFGKQAVQILEEQSKKAVPASARAD